MLELKNVSITISKDSRPIVKDFNLVVFGNEKIAIIGEEGNGKSTLLKYIYDSNMLNDYCSYEGSIIKKNINIGYLEQLLSPEWKENTVLEYFLKESWSDEIDYEKYNQLSTIQRLFKELGINQNLIDEDHLIGTLSGGEKVKIQIAKILLADCNLLLLDEPTNDLDLETLDWLETFISEAKIPVLFVSHDETLLENTANMIIHLEQIKKKRECRHTIEKMGYEEYYNTRLSSLAKQSQLHRSEKKDLMNERRILTEIKDRVQKANPERTNRMNSLLAQEEKLSKTEITENPDVEEAINFRFFDVNIPNSKMIIDLELPKLKINNNLLSENIALSVYGSEHIVIIGKNGTGKTTLLKLIYQTLSERSDINVGYMPQSYDDLMDLEKTPIEFLGNGKSKDEITIIRTFLGSMKFISDEMTAKIKNLSGGQRAKIMLLKLMIDKCNVLILDEPTRNLSPLSNPVIRAVLANYSGAIISVSHDRKYIDEVCDTVYELSPKGLKKVNTDYMAK